MIEVGNVYVSKAITKSFFVCDLAQCRSACCKDGKYGAPIDKDEIPVLDGLYDKIKTYLPEKNIEYIGKNGLYASDWEGNPCLGMVEGKECVFAGTDNLGNLFCGIEKAYLNNKINFRKPVSCHLYPIRIWKYGIKERIYYDKWKICKPACKNGISLQIPLYKFVKNALVRKYGHTWYQSLEDGATSDKK